MRGGVYFILKYWRLALCQFFLLLSHFSRAPQIPSSNLRWLLLRKRVVRKVAVLAAGLLPFLKQLKFLQVVAFLAADHLAFLMRLKWLLLRKRVARKVAVLAAGLLAFLMQTKWLLLRKRVARKVAVLAAGLLPFLMQLKFLQVVAALPQKTSRVSSQMVALLAASLAIAKLIANVAKALA